jgi:hypothetical protein
MIKDDLGNLPSKIKKMEARNASDLRSFYIDVFSIYFASLSEGTIACSLPEISTLSKSLGRVIRVEFVKKDISEDSLEEHQLYGIFETTISSENRKGSPIIIESDGRGFYKGVKYLTPNSAQRVGRMERTRRSHVESARQRPESDDDSISSPRMPRFLTPGRRGTEANMMSRDVIDSMRKATI